MTSRSMRPDRQFILLYSIILVVSSGNTALMSVLPALGRSLHTPDWLIALTFSFSSLAWALSSPIWARRTDRSGRRAMMLTGLVGFALTSLLCGLALTAGVEGWISPFLAFALVMAARLFYGCLGSAAPPAVQAVVATRTSRSQRTNALSMLASAFGLGTIIGPALAPFFVVAPVGLAGPAYFAFLIGVGMLLLTYLRLPNVEDPLIHPPPAADLSLGGEVGVIAPVEPINDQSSRHISITDRRIRPWMIAGIIAGHAQAMVGQVIAFLVLDRLALQPVEAQPVIGLVLMTGAGASLLAQWGLIPRLNLQPPALVIAGSLAAAIGSLAIAFATNAHALGVGFAIASLGFGLLRPGYTAGASLAVGSREQTAVAGCVSAVNGGTFVLGPSIGIALYHLAPQLPYFVSAASVAVLAAYTARVIRR